ncbi:MAG TPA: amidohydrolase family protein [Chloroflexota bacterium]|nr:amidohydrolase family protein [Chloroflexota bacterium]
MSGSSSGHAASHAATRSAGQAAGCPIVLLAGTVLAPEPSVGVVGILAEGGVIARLLSDRSEAPDGAEVYDLGPDAVLVPGMIDVHTHGGWGLRYPDGHDAARTILRRRAESGCTGLLMTVGGSPEEMVTWLPSLADLVEQPTGGAVALGFHIEGPWLNWDAWVSWGARASSGRELFPPDPDDFFRIQEAARGQIKLVSCAPEFPDALRFIETLSKAGVVPSIGHTTASPQLARDAIQAGVRHATHTFNGMQPLHHRDPGTAGVVLTDPRVVAELIPDGSHVHPIAQQLLYRAKGPDRVALVTDGTRFGGFPQGTYYDGERKLEIRDDLGCWTEKGNLAGSGSPIDRDLAVLTTEGGVPWEHAARMGATVPAIELGLGTHKGRLIPGYDADIAVFAPVSGAMLGGGLRVLPGSDRRCILTMVGGQIVYRREQIQGQEDDARAREDEAMTRQFRAPEVREETARK